MRSLGPLRRTAQATLRDNLRDVAANRGWTLTRCAREADLSYSKLTQGMSANRWFLPEEITALANAFEVSSDELIGDSVFKDNVRGSKYDVPQPWEKDTRNTVGTTGNGRALCCRCGFMRRFRVDEIDHARTEMDGSPAQTGGRRMTLPLRCQICNEETTHARLRELSSHRDIAETYEQGPTKEQQARADLAALVTKVSSFNVAVVFRTRGKKRREEGFMTSYEYDSSKSHWRIEVDPNAPATLQVDMLADAWRRVAVGDHGNISWDPADGVVWRPSDSRWNDTADALMADIVRALPAEREKYRLETVDQLQARDAAHEVSDR